MLVAVKVLVVVMFRTGRQVLPVHVQDGIRPGQVQQVRVTGHVLRVVAQAVPRGSRPG